MRETGKGNTEKEEKNCFVFCGSDLLDSMRSLPSFYFTAKEGKGRGGLKEEEGEGGKKVRKKERKNFVLILGSRAIFSNELLLLNCPVWLCEDEEEGEGG